MYRTRRDFIATTGTMMLSAASMPALTSPTKPGQGLHESNVSLYRRLLTRWCDAMVELQVTDPIDPDRLGAITCPACGVIHGRNWETLCPFMYMADSTGDEKYLRAALKLFEWSTKCDSPDGAWNSSPHPKRNEWKNTSVFGAVALAEALRHHGHLLDKAVRDQWMARVRKAGEFIYKNFRFGMASNVNYPMTATYAMVLLGELFDDARYTARGKELAQDARAWFTEQNQLIFGEGRPHHFVSPKGCKSVDLGYNVEESLPALALYSHMTNDEEMREIVESSLKSHLEFMLPDGAWDNSWGTRNFKWTYWGSRTSDGCQPAYELMADRNPAFAKAAYLNTRLLEACTHDGLLYGGPHYVSHGVKPCVHHTFCHSKALATLLDSGVKRSTGVLIAKLPREKEYGIREFPEIQTWLVSKGPWRATVTDYDWIYKHTVMHGSGGAISMLWHERVGPVLSASLTEYSMQEPGNMQPVTDKFSMALTPRLEIVCGEKRFNHLYDLDARVEKEETRDGIDFHVYARLLHAPLKEPESPVSPESGEAACTLDYRFTQAAVEISARMRETPEFGRLEFVLPVISPSGERVRRTGSGSYIIEKPAGKVAVSSNVALNIPDFDLERVFNHVPGFEAVPLVAEWDVKAVPTLQITLQVLPS